ncbi:hypothetical protein R1sor_022009 [Riccia sorocarpa]|uniref:Uncharacterized protein n=1 Tax=Riccia sorocarpa TaxID=122646 RepID=A0ABD3GIN0_9MARC
MEIKAKSFLARKVLRLIQGGDVGWFRIATAIINRAVSLRSEIRCWLAPEILLLLSMTRITGAPTLSRLLGAWKEVKRYLNWNEEDILVKPDLSIDKLEALITNNKQELTGQMKRARRWWRKLGWNRAGDFMKEGDLMQVTEQELWRLGIFLEEEDWVALQNTLAEFSKLRSSEVKLQHTQGWAWIGIDHRGSPWELDLRILQKKLYEGWLQKTAPPDSANQTCGLRAEIWKKLWNCPVSFRVKAEIWRYAHEGFFTNMRAWKIRVREWDCTCCDEAETIPTIWRERNAKVFEGKRTEEPVRVLVRRSIQEVLARFTQSEAASVNKERASSTLEEWYRSETGNSSAGSHCKTREDRSAVSAEDAIE